MTCEAAIGRLTGHTLRVSMPELFNVAIFHINLISDYPKGWGCGAVGSAREWHSRGRRFNPGQLHQTALRACRRLF
jgi:hypothetical protein